MSSLPVTPASLGRLPIALTLPDELWIKILRHFNYKQLKRTARICKKLRGFIQGTEFDRVLYRAGPRSPAYGKGHKVFLHPMIDKTDGIFTKLEDARILGDSRVYFPKDYPAILDEFATRPASTQINIEIDEELANQPRPLVKSTGITLRDFLQHLGNFWSTPAVRYGMTGFRNAEDVQFIDVLGAHSAWTDWYGGVAQGGNRTKVRAGDFDS